MPQQLPERATKVIGTLIVLAFLSGLLFYWFWQSYPLYAFFVSGLLASGGAQALPSRNLFAHSTSIGFCIGAFIGGVLGAIELFQNAPN